jgi:hypothetical protein
MKVSARAVKELEGIEVKGTNFSVFCLSKDLAQNEQAYWVLG